MKFFLAIAALFLASLCLAEKTSYKGFKLVRIQIKNHELIEKLHSYELDDPEYDVWGVSRINGGYEITVMLSPKVFVKYMRIFQTLNLDANVVNHNVQDIIEQWSREEKSMAKNNGRIVNSYVDYSKIRSFVLDEIHDKNKDITTTYVSGRTYGGRELLVIKFKIPEGPANKRAIWLDCGIHAREWVTPATCVYIIDTLVKEYRARNPETIALLSKYEIHILPLYNPDGYQYSIDSTRLWRKNRSPQGIIGVLDRCYGVDLNRNADFRWNTGGASSSCISDVFAGPKGNSENETIALVNALTANQGNWDAYYSVHSYGDWWLLPWGHDPNDKPPNWDELLENGRTGAAAIKAVHGEVFTVGSSSGLLYVTTGSTADWAYGVLDIKIAVTLELRPGNTTADASHGFQLPEDRLVKVTEETWAGLKASMIDVSNRRP